MVKSVQCPDMKLSHKLGKMAEETKLASDRLQEVMLSQRIQFSR